MKRALFFILMVIAALQMRAQTVFAPQGATWQFTKAPDYYHFRAGGYVTVAGKQCTYITEYWHDPDSKYVTWRGSFNTYTSGDTVYYSRLNGRLVPLYIFNVQAGDTVAFYKSYINSTDSFFHVRIDSVKLMHWGTALLKTVFARAIDTKYAGGFFARNNPARELYVERIGCVYCDGLLPWTAGIRIPECICDISCYYDGVTDVRLYADSCNGVPASVEKNTRPNFTVYPNPATDAAIIQFSKPCSGKTFLMLYDMFGRKRYETVVISGSQNFTLPMSQMPAGTYHIAIFSDAGNVHHTVIKE